ncbi:MAG: CBS domain-containing protein [Bacteroidota bacterium]|jgi:predicted transcriptional regulator|nr:CBS domain-containing protein [Bacteroidota bacterium]
MVKSYQGEGSKKVRQVDVQPFFVSDYMATKLITFDPEQNIEDVMCLLLEHNISGGTVVNANCEVLGVISEGDCLKDIVKGKYHNQPIQCGKVKDYMAVDVICIPADTSIFEAAHMFLSLKVRRFPVVKDGKLIGQVSQRDIIKAVQNLKSSNW